MHGQLEMAGLEDDLGSVPCGVRPEALHVAFGEGVCCFVVGSADPCCVELELVLGLEVGELAEDVVDGLVLVSALAECVDEPQAVELHVDCCAGPQGAHGSSGHEDLQCLHVEG